MAMMHRIMASRGAIPWEHGARRRRPALFAGMQQFYSAGLRAFVPLLFAEMDSAANAKAIEVAADDAVAVEIDAVSIGFEEAVVFEEFGYHSFVGSTGYDERRAADTIRISLQTASHLMKGFMDGDFEVAATVTVGVVTGVVVDYKLFARNAQIHANSCWCFYCDPATYDAREKLFELLRFFQDDFFQLRRMLHVAKCDLWCKCHITSFAPIQKT